MSEKPRTKPILRWPGGKSRLLKTLLPMIPAHDCYCEPFFGGGAVLFAKERSSVEVINDINSNLVALYRNLQFHLPALISELDWLFASRDNLRDFNQQPGLTELQRAARFLLLNRTSFGGGMRSFGVVKGKGGGIGFDHNKIDSLLEQANARLNGVVVENLPFDRCLKNYDAPATFFFLDPPYLNSDANAYAGWDEDQMRNFRKAVEKLKGKWIATVDDSKFNRQLFSDCAIVPVQTRSQLCNISKTTQNFGELIVTPK